MMEDANRNLNEPFDLWRNEHPSEALHAKNVAAVVAAIEDFHHGDRGTPAGEDSAVLRREFGVDAE